MGCGCGGRRRSADGSHPGDILGYVVTYPDGSVSSDTSPFMSIAEAKAEVRTWGGGTIRKLVRKTP